MVSNSKEYSLAYYHAQKIGDTVCECGKKVSTYNKYRHRTSKFHLKYLAISIPEEISTPEEIDVR